MNIFVAPKSRNRHTICLFIIVLLAACKGVKTKNFLTVEHIKGKPSAICESFYLMERRDSVLVKGGLEMKTCYDIDKNGNKTTWKEYSGDGSLKWAAVSAYKDGRETECSATKENGSKDWREVYVYDEFGNRTEQREFDAEGKLHSKIIFRYDTKGNRTERFYYDANESLFSKSVYLYDSSGNLQEEDVYAPTGEMKSKTESKFEQIDKEGNWQLQIIYSNGQPCIVSERQITYY
jgi:hypothetical protein